MTETEGGASLVDIGKRLEGLNLPARKQDVTGHARSKGANQDEITALERLPDQEFTTIADVLQGVGQVDAPG
jgi:Protein of unknown function (DUF2795)